MDREPVKLEYEAPPVWPSDPMALVRAGARIGVIAMGFGWSGVCGLAALVYLIAGRGDAILGCALLASLGLPGLAVAVAVGRWWRIKPRPVFVDPEWQALEHDPKFIESIATARQQVRAGR